MREREREKILKINEQKTNIKMRKILQKTQKQRENSSMKIR